MFVGILSSLSLVVVTNLHQNRNTQEKVLTKEEGLFFSVAYVDCCLLLSEPELEIVYVKKKVCIIKSSFIENSTVNFLYYLSQTIITGLCALE